MNIVWLIGNGFDVACGLDTRYTDFYASDYVQKNHGNMIYSKIKEDIKTWADFEYQLGKLSLEIMPNERNKFIDDIKRCYEDFSEYLGNQENCNKAAADKLDVFQDDFIDFFKFCEPDDMSDLIGLLDRERQRYNRDKLSYNSSCIVFNYTGTFHSYFNMLRHASSYTGRTPNILFQKSELCYVHSNISNGIIMGCDNASQYNLNLLGSLSFYLDKSQANTESRSGNLSKATKIINSGQIFVVFGMSLGETDKRWWNAIAERVLSDTAHRIVVFNYLPHEEVKMLYSRIENQKKIQETFVSRLDGITSPQKEILRNRIIVINSCEAFNMSSKDDKILVTT